MPYGIYEIIDLFCKREKGRRGGRKEEEFTTEE
jgi:hypothetical protein